MKAISHAFLTLSLIDMSAENVGKSNQEKFVWKEIVLELSGMT